MLIIRRSRGQELIIETPLGPVIVEVSGIGPVNVTLTVHADRAIPVWRGEIQAERDV